MRGSRRTAKSDRSKAALTWLAVSMAKSDDDGDLHLLVVVFSTWRQMHGGISLVFMPGGRHEKLD